MALLKIVLDVLGGTPVELVVTHSDSLPLVLTGLAPGTVHFNVANPLDRNVVLTALVAEVTGAAAAKIGPPEIVPAGAITIPALGTVEVDVTVTPLEPIMEGETLTITLTAQE